jgi:putative ABC transport system permease protein
MNWWRRLVHREQLDRDLDRELQYHVDRQVEDNLQAGMTADKARRLVRVQFGGLEQVKEDCRDARGTRWAHELAADLLYACRLLVKERGFTTVAVAALALGIGVNNTFFIVINAVCLRGLPINDANRVLYVATRDAHERDAGVSYKDFRDLEAGTRAFEGLAAFATAPAVIGGEGSAPERAAAAYVSALTFRLLHERPLLGRDFVPTDDAAGAPRVVLLSSALWKTRYGSDSAILGRRIQVNGLTSTVIGVMRVGFRYPDGASVWQPLALLPGLMNQSRDSRALGVVGRLRDGAGIAEASTELEAAAGQLARQSPDTNNGIRIIGMPINDRYNARLTDPVWLAFMTAGLLVLLIACANVANLLLMRASERTREVAIRFSLGATRVRVVRQLLAESAIVALLGGVAGLGVSLVGARLLSVALTGNAPYWLQFTMDARGFLALAAVCVSTVFIFGLAPAVHASKTEISGRLHQAGPGSIGGLRARRWTSTFLAAEFALTTVLLAAVIVGFRNYGAARATEVAINPAHLLTAWVSLPAERYPTPEQRLAFYERVQQRLRGLGGVSSAALATALPFGGATARALQVEGQPVVSEAPPIVSTVTIDDRYFEALGLPLVQGRTFAEVAGVAKEHAVIVNQRFVAMYFPDQTPIGRRVRLGDAGDLQGASWLTIIGVCPTIRQRAQGVDSDPVVYLSLQEDPPAAVALLLRHTSDEASLPPLLRQELRSLDPELPLDRVMSMGHVISESKLGGRVSQALITVIACIAICLSVVGLYAVTGHAVVQRTHEIGLRTALGAQSRQVMGLVLQRALTQLGYGLAAGVACTGAWQRLLGDPTQRYRLTDPVTLAMVAGIVISVAMAACVRPARRAAQLDPVAALRHD